MSDSTMVERLLRDHPPAALPDDLRDAHRRQLRALVAAEPVPATTTFERRRRRRWRSGGTVVLIGGLVIASGGAVAAFVMRALPDDPTLVRCFSVAAPPFATGAPGTIDASLAEDDSLVQSAARAIELCGYYWADGALPWPETKGPTDSPPGGSNPVPDLQACILPDGIVGVFPGDDQTCTALGLPSSSA